MSVTFRSKQAGLSVAHETLFHVGVQHDMFNNAGEWIGSPEEWEKRQKLPDPDMVGKSYQFFQGEDHNELTLTREDAIEGMRAYIQQSGDNLIVELDENGNEPSEPEGTPFVAKKAGYVLTPAMYMHNTSAEGKTFRFVMGAERNKYITADPDEIRILRAYVKEGGNCAISDPTYKAPFSGE
jgi:hypothetical protein